MSAFRRVFSALALVAACTASAGDRPNVILIITDDQGYGDMSATGNPILKTPEMDALHESSVRLTDYHVSPTCAPTRGALMSGHYTNRAGPWHTIMGRSFLRVGETTMAQVFSDNGYASGLFGKWHLGDNYPYRPQDRGFTEVVAHGGGGVGQTPDHWDNAYFDDVLLHNGQPQQYEGFCTDVFFEEAIRFMDEKRKQDQPFFAYISTNAPHSPFHCPEEYWKPYLDRGLSEREAIFFGMIANIDENIGRLREWLQEQGLEEDTILIFTTDNGTASGRRIFNAGMRGAKTSEYDGGHRVPFFMRWPAGGLATPKDIEELTAHIDVLPTLIELCDLEPPADYQFDGRSLVPLLYGHSSEWEDRVVITDSQRVRDPIKWRKSSTMTDRWRLINGEELYEIRVDPGQADDVSQENPEVVTRLRAVYEEWWADISPSFSVYERIEIGNEADNPTQLTCHDWLTDNVNPPWNQGHVRSAQSGTGYWAVRVETPGTYRISLRRWPRDVLQPIWSDLEPGSPVPGLEAYRSTPGKGIHAKSALLKIGEYREEVHVSETDQFALFEVELAAGDYDLWGVFRTDQPGLEEVGAYYAVVERL